MRGRHLFRGNNEPDKLLFSGQELGFLPFLLLLGFMGRKSLYCKLALVQRDMGVDEFTFGHRECNRAEITSGEESVAFKISLFMSVWLELQVRAIARELSERDEVDILWFALCLQLLS